MAKRASIKKLRSLFSYNPETGDLTWKNDWLSSRHKHRIGDIAGGISMQGYRCVNINYLPQLVHRIAWAIMTGRWPKHQIDHINMVRTDNRWCNLREATNSQNSMNRKAQSNNKTGLKGVYSHSHGGYFSSICRDKKTRYLGYFKTPSEAKAAYDAASKELHAEFHRS